MRVSMSAIGSVIIFAALLPARLGHARDLALHGDLAHLAAREPELAEVPARTPGERAAVAHAHRRGVAREALELRASRLALLVGHLRILDDLEQFSALRCVLRGQLAALFVAQDCGELRHRKPLSS